MEKLANLIAVGGPVAVGKSTLVNRLPFPKVDELDQNDTIQDILLDSSYTEKRAAIEVVEMFFLERRKERYELFSNTLTTYVFDRTIIETFIFAEDKMDPKTFIHFKKLFEAEVKELFENFGKPKLYLILTCNWDTFYNRLFSRGREVEIMNFHSNLDYFKNHVEKYQKRMVEMMEKFEINYKVLDTTHLNADQVYELAMKHIEDANIQ